MKVVGSLQLSELPYLSVIDHTLSGSCQMSFLHLHHIQAYVLVAESIPVAIARNFQSPPRLNMKCYPIYVDSNFQQKSLVYLENHSKRKGTKF